LLVILNKDFRQFVSISDSVFRSGQVYQHNLQFVFVMTGTKQPGYKTGLCRHDIRFPLIFDTSVAECKDSVAKNYHFVIEPPNGLRSCFLTCKITS